MNRHDIFWKTAVRIRDTYRDHIKGEEAYVYSEDAARELQDAGLLAPDLPTLKSDYASIEVPVRSTIINMHDDPERYDDDSILVGTWNGEVEFSLGKFDEVSVYMSTDQARQFAHALLGVANYSETETE